jgi:hypothetical protein
VLDKVLSLGKARFICSPAVLANPNPPMFWVVDLPGLVIVLCFKDKEGRDRLSYCVNASDQIFHSWSPG